MKVALVALAGAAGALSRYGVGVLVGVRSFPWATLAINVAGSFLLGLVLVAAPTRLSADATVALAVGFLGAFTTFSTFSHEATVMMRTGRPADALLYVALSVGIGLVAAAAGHWLGQQF